MAASKPLPATARAVQVARGALVAGYVLAIAAALFHVDGRRWVWTVAIAVLPAFWVIGGFHLWRRLCPLAFFSQIPRLRGRPGEQKIEGWHAANALGVQLGVMVAALSARLLWVNGSRWGLGLFLAAVAGLAYQVGTRYRGRTWCHYLCPVGLVERIYTEPSRLMGTANSQCSTCSACTKQCPDIDAERSYWKTAEDRNRRIAYFAWPGLVFGFYAHYWVQAGTWDWYFSGDWTRESDIATRLFSAGWFFGDLPRILAAPLTLLVCGAVSYGLFAAGHRVATRIATKRAGGTLDGESVERLRHRAYVLAGYIGFNVFYAYAGQPTLRRLPGWVQWAAGVTVVAASTFLFLRRWGRSEAAMVQDRLAKKLARRWTWDDDATDRSSTELVVLHTERTRQRKERLDSYQQSVAELAAEGILSTDGLAALRAVRATLGITEREHDKVLAGLDLTAASPEAALQQEQYRAALEQLVAEATEAGRAVDERRIAELQRRYGVDADEHGRMLEALLDPDGALRGPLVERAARLVTLGHLAEALGSDDAPPADRSFVATVITEVGTGPAEALHAALATLGDAPDGADELLSTDPARRAATARALLAGPLAADAPSASADPLGDALQDDDAALARAVTLLRGPEPADGLRRLVALHSVALFAGLPTPDLEELDARATVRSYAVDDALCTQGDDGDEVLVILSGAVRILVSGREVSTCGPGDCIGELAVLAPAPRSASVLANEPTDALVLAGGDFRELLREQPMLVEEVLGQVARRLQRATG